MSDLIAYYKKQKNTINAPPDLATAQVVGVSLLNDAAETSRLKYVTPGSAKSMVYDEKVREAKAIAIAAAPDPLDYPLLNAEANGSGVALSDLATTVLAKRQAWVVLAADIEEKTRVGKLAIEAAPDRAGIYTALRIEWP